MSNNGIVSLFLFIFSRSYSNSVFLYGRLANLTASSSYSMNDFVTISGHPNALQILAATREGILSVCEYVIIGQPLQRRSQEVVWPFVMALSRARSAK